MGDVRHPVSPSSSFGVHNALNQAMDSRFRGNDGRGRPPGGAYRSPFLDSRPRFREACPGRACPSRKRGQQAGDMLPRE